MPTAKEYLHSDDLSEERDAKAPKIYLSNVKVVWTNGTNVSVTPRDGEPQAQTAPQSDDLPF